MEFLSESPRLRVELQRSMDNFITDESLTNIYTFPLEVFLAVSTDVYALIK